MKRSFNLKLNITKPKENERTTHILKMLNKMNNPQGNDT